MSSRADLRVVERREPRFLRVRDAAADIGCSEQHVRNLIARGRIPALTLDRIVLIASKDWDKYTSTAEPVRDSS